MTVVAAALVVSLTVGLSTGLRLVSGGRRPTPEERVLDRAEYERAFGDR